MRQRTRTYLTNACQNVQWSTGWRLDRGAEHGAGRKTERSRRAAEDPVYRRPPDPTGKRTEAAMMGPAGKARGRL
jgi:hypothetical protein